MSVEASPVIVFPGASNIAPHPAILNACFGNSTRLKTICYPGWQRYIQEDFSAEALIRDLASEIANIVPSAPIRILGISIGGHFAYAAALRLQASGRQIAGLCVIDTFMIASSAPRAGWKGRALMLGLEQLRNRRIGDLQTFVRSRFLRALFRLMGGRLPSMLRHAALSGGLVLHFARNQLFEEELSMRLLISTVAPWIGSLDLDPIPLKSPAILIRTAEGIMDDTAWRRRCPSVEVFEIPGTHQTIFEPENIGALHNSFVRGTRDWWTNGSDDEQRAP